jgi:hypothetical protein
MAALLFALVASAYGGGAGRIVRERKGGGPDESPGAIELAIDVAFSKQVGETVTDQNGTFYHVFGMVFYEDLVYPPQYWGVFPLYFFGEEVGINVNVANLSAQKAAFLLRCAAYCLRTDGSNGAQLLAPTDRVVAIAKNGSANIDSSFVAGYVEGAESGLDRFIVKALDQNGSESDGHVIGGELLLNPANNSDMEFTLTLPDDSTITHDDLQDGYPGYAGAAVAIHFKPKGNGNQNALIVDGQSYPLSNAETYDFLSDSMTVNLYNAGNGNTMGQWWIAVDATDATIICSGEEAPGLIMSKEAIFCPPEYNGEAMQAVENVLAQ